MKKQRIMKSGIYSARPYPVYLVYKDDEQIGHIQPSTEAEWCFKLHSDKYSALSPAALKAMNEITETLTQEIPLKVKPKNADR